MLSFHIILEGGTPIICAGEQVEKYDGGQYGPETGFTVRGQNHSQLEYTFLSLLIKALFILLSKNFKEVI